MNQNNFIDELLAEVESKEMANTIAHHDMLIMEIARLENEIANNFTQSEQEITIIKDWALKKNAVIDERISFIKAKLEAYLRSENKKTLDLPHGVIRLRQTPIRYEISDLSLFMQSANESMLTIIPEQIKPDLNKIKACIKMSGRIPIGITEIPSKESFSLTIKANEVSNDNSK